MDQFYSTVAQTSFTLLALYWVLLQLRHDEWFGNPAYRRSAYDVSLYFLLPGMMSLLSLLAVSEPNVWRVSFVLFGTIGVVESVLVMSRRGELGAGDRLVRVADVASIALYALAILIALWRELPDKLGLDLRPLEVEGIVLAALLGLGVVLGAAMFVSTGPQASGGRA